MLLLYQNLRTFRNYILNTGLKFVIFSLHSILAIRYWRQGKKVPPVYNSLLLKSATQLAKEIREGKTKSEDVVRAYVDRIFEVEPDINATVEFRFQEALEEAKEVDSLVASKKFTPYQLAEEKPLLGVPFTVKVFLTVKGLRCTSGSLLLKDEVATEDSPCVGLMKKAGAIVIATTNMPELGLYLESNNYVHGKTSNPYDIRRMCGGTSGGEGALIGAAGSVIGLGNDVGGSVRLPSFFNGIFGHKPTGGLVSNGGCYPPVEFFGNYLCTGPMCRYAEDLVTIMNILTSGNQIQTPFGLPVDFKKLKIRYMEQLKHPFVYPVDKEIIRGLHKVATYFQNKYGADVQEAKLPLLNKAYDCGVYNIQAKMNKLPNLYETLTDGKGAHLTQEFDLFKYLFGRSTFTLNSLLSLFAFKYQLLCRKNNFSYYHDILEKLGKEFDDLLDENTVFLFPTFPTTAPYHHESIPLLPSTAYTYIFNCLELPSTQCPLGLSEQGLPYGIQIITRKNNDPLTIACALELEEAFGGWIPPVGVRV